MNRKLIQLPITGASSTRPGRSTALPSFAHAGTTALLLVLIAGFAVGCDSLLGWTDSGIQTALNSADFLRAAGASNGVEVSVSPLSPARPVTNSYSVQTDLLLSATITSGTSTQLLAAYENHVKRTIESKGGKINASGSGSTVIGATVHHRGAPSDKFNQPSTGDTGSTGGSIRYFSYGYAWGGHAGIVKVYAFEHGDSALQIFVFSYEHRR